MIIPLLVLAHLMSLFSYMYFGDLDSQAWSTYYYSSERVFTALFVLTFAYKQEKTYLDKQFLGIEGGYNLLLGVVYVIKDYNIFPYIAVFRNVAILVVYLLIATVILTFNIYRYGLYKDR